MISSKKELNVFVAGATGWAGSALAKGIHANENMNLVGGLSRSNANGNLSQILQLGADPIPIFSDATEALSELEIDVFVEYTKPDSAKKHILLALEAGVNVVIGTSGLDENDFKEIEIKALDNECSVLAVGNFAITAALLKKFSLMAAQYISDFEIIDFASETKKDAPSGTARELSQAISNIQESTIHVAGDDILGPKGIRGARMGGVQVHSVRLPGHVLSIETIFGKKDERLSIRHDAGSSAEPYVAGGLLAIQKVGSFKGLKRGLDAVMDF